MKTLVFCVFCVFYVNCQKIVRLSPDVRPTHYAITIESDLNTDTISGRVQIDLNVESQQNNITLNSRTLNITEVYLNGTNLNYEFDDDKHLLSVYNADNKPIVQGGYNLTIIYDGSIKAEPEKGLWKASLPDGNSTADEFLIVSDFEPIGARYVFPCFDEPDFKAQFSINVKVLKKGYFAISNMPLKQDSRISEGLYEFEKSVPMSTYLVCIVITNLPFSEHQIGDKKIRFYSKDKDQGKKVEILGKVYDWYQDYFNFTDPLRKVDFVDYNKPTVGTENWGLISFKSGIITSDKFYEDYQINAVLFHEVGHSWIGNLVTNKWWDDLWLQEGLDSFLTEKALIHVLNEDIGPNYLQGQITHLVGKIQQPVDTYERFDELFGDLIYQKATTVFRMIESVDPDSFKLGLRQYIRDFQYKTATTDDLIKSFEKVNKDIPWRDFFESYIYQEHHPLVNIRKEGDQFVLTQECWSLDKLGENWTIPLHYSTDKNPKETLVWFHRNMEQLTIPAEGAKLLILNQNHKGYYRFNYDDQLWKTAVKIIDGLTILQQKSITEELDLLYNAGIKDCSLSFEILSKACREAALKWYYLRYDLIGVTVENEQTLINRLRDHTFGRFHKGSLHFRRREDQKLPERLQKCMIWIKNHSEKFIQQFRNVEDTNSV